jgi:hypothetical protein
VKVHSCQPEITTIQKERTLKLSKAKRAKGRYLSRHLLSGSATQSVKTIQ